MASCADLRIVLLGKTGQGKSETGNTILNSPAFETDSSLDSVTKSCQEQTANVDGKIISVVDTPGLFDTSMTKEQLQSEIQECVNLSVPGPHVFLLVIRLDVKYTEEEKNTVKWIQENFGDDALKYTIILFTHDHVLSDKTLDEYIGKSNNVQALCNQYGGRCHSFNNKNRENRDQVKQLLNKIDEMVEKNGGDHYSNKMYKESQDKIKWENFKRTAINYGKTSLTVIGGAVIAGGAVMGTAAAVVAAAGSVEAAGAAAVTVVTAGAKVVGEQVVRIARP